MFRFIRGYRKEAVLAPLFKMSEALLELLVPLVVKNIIDTGLAAGNEKYVLQMCAVLCGLALAGLAFSVTAQYFAAKAAVGYAAAMKQALFRHICSLSYADTDALGTSQLITRMTSDADKVQSGLNLSLRLLLRSPFVVFGAMIMAFTVDKTSALVFVGTIPALSVVVFAIMLASMPLYKAVQKRLDGVTSATRSGINGARVIRAFGREETETEKFTRENSLLNAASRKAGRISALINPLTYVILNLATILLLKTGALRVDAGLISQGAVVALYNYMAQILVELIKLADLIISITRALACSKRIKAVFAVTPSRQYPETGVQPDFTAPAVEFAGVDFTYPGAAEPSLADAGFTVKQGERIGITGATGSGKSTLVQLIPGFYLPDSGTVKLFGHDIKEYTQKQLNELTAYVPQKAVLFSGSIRENLLWGNENATEAQLLDAVKTAQAIDVLEAKENGMDELLTEGGKNLSGGQRQRLTVARALVKNAPILILDDSTSALDAATDAAMREAIGSLPGQPTVFIVSQRVSSVKDCDRILVTDDGRIAGFGTHEELLRENAIYREICASQTKGGTENG